MSRSQKKANRLLQIEALLLAHPEGLTQADIARKLQVNRSTVGRYFPDLPGHIYLDDLDGSKWKVDREGYLVNVRFNLHEALAIHLATRLLATRMDRQNPHAAAALRKLGASLERLASQISAHIKQSADVMDDAARRHDPLYVQVLEKLTLAWAEGRKVEVWHRYEPTGAVHKYKFSPYFVEPYAVGQTTHVIGWREPPGAMRTFKIERIERIELLAEPYTVPVDFDPRQFLTDAWGIWYTENEPQEVVLRFSRSVANRVRESRWHQSEQLVEEADGRLLWQAKVAEPQEMLPWIRGWGADVEVLGPLYLRRQLQDEVICLSQIYEDMPTTAVTPQLHHTLYAKTDKATGAIHLLLYHLIDVGQVAACLWQDVLTVSIRQRFARWLNLNIDDAGRFLAFLAALHDLGKASPAYQSKYAPDWLRTKLNEAGLVLIDKGEYLEQTKKAPHGTVSTWALPKYLEEVCQLSPRFANKIATAVGGHHGVWPGPRATDFIDDGRYPAWQQVRDELVQELITVFQPPIASIQLRGEPSNAFLTLFSGFTSVADWLGSREDAFPFEERPLPTEHYAQQAKTQAHQALQNLGWKSWQPKSEQKTFMEMFAYLNIQQPREVQVEVIAAAQELPAPSLLILEAPTGIGKTETAFFLADTWLQKHGGRGLYIAMPTQATSNQMFERTVAFLRQRYPDDFVTINLAHGQWRLNDKLTEISLRTVGENENGRIAAMSWFMEKSKRSLLSPFAVGTVDQALLSILQTKHFFVRLFGLAHKVVIFDEVHAYDTYMSTLFVRLLGWLHAIGASVILLSATLPSETRRKLVQGYMGDGNSLDADFYPALTIASDSQSPQIISLTAPKDERLDLAWLESREPDEIVSYLRQALAEGGCAAVICNTVSRVQQLCQALADAQLGIDPDNLILFHARFPPIWRKAIEDKVLDKFGKDVAKRPSRAIVIATQVIEQSLDLDFDVMITDLAPIDLILQRAGRLHRHKRDDDQPRRHPRCLTIAPPDLDEDNLPQWGNDGLIYEPYILLRSYLALQDSAEALVLPSQTRSLIEFVYTANPPQHPQEKWQKVLQDALKEMQREQHHSMIKAGHSLIRAADDPDLLFETHLDLEEDNPAVHESFQAKTRDIAPGIDLICLHETASGLFLAPDDPTTQVDLTQEPFGKLLKTMLNYKMTIQHWPTLQHCIQSEQQAQRPSAWQRNAMLRHCHPLVFKDGRYRFVHNEKQYQLRLDRKLGLQWEVL